MKKFFLFTSFVLYFLCQGFSQGVLLFKDHDGNVLNGQTITLQGDINMNFFSAQIELSVQNSGNSPLVVSCRKEVLSAVIGTFNDFCWNGSCYDDSYTVAPTTYALAAGATTPPEKPFGAHYHCQGLAGTTTVKYYVYVAGTTNESWIIVNYVVNNVSVPSRQVSNQLIYPNPANDVIYIDAAAFAQSDVQVQVFNMVGQKVFDCNFGVVEKASIDCSAWNKGVYVLRVYSSGSLIRTTKITKK